MADKRDFRIKVDLSFPPKAAKYMEQIREALLPLYNHAIGINSGAGNEEPGFIEVERCGHRLNLPCEVIARWETGKGKVI